MQVLGSSMNLILCHTCEVVLLEMYVFLYQKNSISKSENDKGEDLQDILVIFFSDISVIVNS